MDDARLLARFAGEKSQDAFAEIVRRHVGMVYAVCRRQLRDAHWAEDVTQAVFILLASKAAGLPENVILGGWLYKAAHYACSNARAMHRTRAYHEHQVTPMNHAHGQDALEKAELESLLDQGLLHLSRPQRDVLILRFFENKTLAQIAQTRRTSLYATTKTLDAALAKLRRYLAQRGVAASAVLIAGTLGAQRAHAAPAGLAAAVHHAAVGNSGGVSIYVSRLAAHLVKHAGRTKLVATLALAAGLLLIGFTALELIAAPLSAATAHRTAPASGAALAQAPPPQLSDPQARQEIIDTLQRAQAALRAMDNPALLHITTFSDDRDRQNWNRIAGVFAANQSLKEAAAARFGAAGQNLTAIKTPAERLDEILPQVDPDSLQWEIHAPFASIHFAYQNSLAPGATIYFLKENGLWKIDATRSLDVALEGLGENLTRVAIDNLPEDQQAQVLAKLDSMQHLFLKVAAQINSDRAYTLAHAQADLQSAADPAQARAFFHLALRTDDFGQPRSALNQ